MIVMMTAITPSVNAVSRSRSMCPRLRSAIYVGRDPGAIWFYLPLVGRLRSEPHRQIHRADLVGGLLRRVFARADDMREAELEGAECHRRPHLQVAHQVQLVDASALLEAVAVQEQIAPDG